MNNEQPNPRPALIVNAGGQSQRMGRVKALLPTPPDGEPLIAHVVRRLAPLGVARTIVVANDPELPAQADLPGKTIFVPDAYPDTGTLGGIATGLHQVDGWAIVGENERRARQHETFGAARRGGDPNRRADRPTVGRDPSRPRR